MDLEYDVTITVHVSVMDDRPIPAGDAQHLVHEVIADATMDPNDWGGCFAIITGYDLVRVDPDPLPYSVGLADQCIRLRRFATEDEAAEFIGTLEGAEDGRYYLDGPER